MSLLTIFKGAASEPSGFAAEQVLHNRGFYEIGRRTDAIAWTVAGANEVIRISRDAIGSTAFFSLAQSMKGNPYMPIVLGQKTMDSGDHIACIERLENPSQSQIFSKFESLSKAEQAGVSLTGDELKWKNEFWQQAITTKSISDFFMMKNYDFDFSTLPEPGAFREASIAIMELTEEVYKKHPLYIPSPDFNPTNIMWRRTEDSLSPVLYDPIKRQDDHGTPERNQANRIRSKLGMPNLG